MNSSDVPGDGEYEKGLKGIYAMAYNFVQLVHPLDKTTLFEALHVQINPGGSISIDNELLKNWKFWTEHYSGFFGCLIVGAILILLVPFIIMIYGCFRCAGRCGSKATGRQQNSCKYFLSIVLILLNIFILAGAVCAFMTNDQISKSITDSQTGKPASNNLLTVLGSNSKMLRNYFSGITNETSDIFERLNTTLVSNLTNLPIESDLLKAFNGSQVYHRISEIDEDINRVCSAWKNISSHFDTLVKLAHQADNEVAKLIEILNNTKHCNECQDLMQKLESYKFVGSLSEYLQIIKELNITKYCDQDAEKIIRDELKKGAEPYKKKLVSAANDALSQVKDIDKTLQDLVGKVNNVIGLSNVVTNRNDDVTKYEKYRFYVFIGIASFILLIVLLGLIGSFLGISEGSKISTRRSHGASVLCCNLVLIFFFFSYLMFIVTITFISGGVFYVETCRGFDQQSKASAIQLVDSFVNKFINKTDFSLLTTLNDCNKNKGLIEALNLKEFLELKFDYKSEIKKKVDEVNFTSLKVPDLPNLSNISSFFDDIKFNYSAESSKKLIDELNRVPINGTFQEIVKNLSSLVDSMNKEMNEANDTLNYLKSYLNNSSLSKNNYDNFTKSFKDDFEKSLKGVESRFKEIITKTLIDIVSQALNSEVYSQLGKCRDLSRAFNNIKNAFCSHLLKPYNGYWFSFGWCVTSLFPMAILMFVLVKLYSQQSMVSPEEFQMRYYNYSSNPNYKK